MFLHAARCVRVRLCLLHGVRAAKSITETSHVIYSNALNVFARSDLGFYFCPLSCAPPVFLENVPISMIMKRKHPLAISHGANPRVQHPKNVALDTCYSFRLKIVRSYLGKRWIFDLSY